MTTGKELQEGAKAPDFSLPDPDGQLVRLSAFAGRKVVLFFYPRADTPGCTEEAQDFSSRLAAFDKAGTAVIGISADPPRKLARFREKQSLKVTLLSDEGLDVLRAYGVWGQKMMYGKSFEGVLRTTFLIGADRKIIEVWRGIKVKNHAEAVLHSVQNRS